MGKGNHNYNKRRRSAAVLAVILILAMLLSIIAPFMGSVYGAVRIATQSSNYNSSEENQTVKPEKEITNDTFKLEAAIGYNGSYVVGRTIPVSGVIENNGASSFQGEVQIKVYSYYASEYSNAPKDYNIYYVPVELAAGAAKQVSMSIYVSTITPFFEISLVDTKGKTVLRKNVTAKALDPTTMMFGVLSDNPSALDYIKQICQDRQHDYKIPPQVVFFKKEDFPSTKDSMVSFQIIFINDFDTKELTKEQLFMLDYWVKRGGLLVLGTGPNASKVLGGLDSIVTGTVEKEYEADLSTAYESLEESCIVPIAEISLENGEILRKGANDIPFISGIKRGNGKIIVQNFDLGIAPLPAVKEIPYALEKDYVLAILDMYKNNSQLNGYNPYVHDFNYIVDNLPAMKTSSLYMIFFAIGLYLVIVGPLLYFVLKKKNKREAGWVLIPAVSLFFTIVIFVLSQNSYYKDSVLNSCSVIELTQGSSVGTADTVSNIKSPKKGTIVFSMDEKIDMGVMEDDEYYYYYSSYDRNQKNHLLKKILAADSTEISYFDNKSWEGNKFSSTTLIELGGTLDMNASLKGNKLKVTVKNNTQTNFEDIVAGAGGRYTKYDSLKAGETADMIIDFSQEMLDSEGQVIHSSDIYTILSQLLDTPYDRSTMQEKIKSGEVTLEEAFNAYKKFEMLERVLRNTEEVSENDFQLSIDFYAFNEDSLWEGDKYVNGKKLLEKNENLYHMTGSLDLTKIKQFEIPYGVIDASIETAIDAYVNSYRYDRYIYAESKQEVICRFDILKEIPLSAFQIKLDDVTSTNIYYEQPQIYNKQIGMWEPLSMEEYTQNLEDYRDQEGGILVRLFMEGQRETSFPQIRVKGGN